MSDNETPTVPPSKWDEVATLPEQVTPVSKVVCPVYIGMVVRYFPGASRQIDPVAGMIITILDGKGNSSSRVDLQTFPADRNTPIRRPSVRHINDSYYDENPEARTQFGAWDYILATDSAIGTSALWKQALSDAIEQTKVELRAEFAAAPTGPGSRLSRKKK